MTAILNLAVALLAGLLMTRIFSRWHLPDVTAFLVTGVLIGPFVLGRLGIPGLGFASYDQVEALSMISDVAMGFLDCWCSEDEQNLISYENGTYDVLMGVARTSENPVARTAFLHDAETMLLGETALSPVYFDGTAHMLRDTLRGVYTDGFGNSYFAGVRANTD